MRRQEVSKCELARTAYCVVQIGVASVDSFVHCGAMPGHLFQAMGILGIHHLQAKEVKVGNRDLLGKQYQSALDLDPLARHKAPMNPTRHAKGVSD
jgi:hypothetical protein